VSTLGGVSIGAATKSTSATKSPSEGPETFGLSLIGGFWPLFDTTGLERIRRAFDNGRLSLQVSNAFVARCLAASACSKISFTISSSVVDGVCGVTGEQVESVMESVRKSLDGDMRTTEGLRLGLFFMVGTGEES
jgi:hypothetical protein